ncbi:hypothetical protein [Streptomyces sp. NPDC093223]|uniref:hypothetical protein n=1 Tax=Streptomyces sp. NPDC093223 TaxID=3366033 RepID=UPI00381FECE2
MSAGRTWVRDPETGRRARLMTIHCDEGEYVDLVVQFTLDPHCPGCGGDAFLRAAGGGPQLVIDHNPGCIFMKEVP